MHKGISILSIVLAAVLGLAAISVHSDDRLGQDEAQTLVEQGQILPLEQLFQLHADLLRGQLLDLELEREQDRLIYEVEVLGEDGRVREFELDAASGERIRESFDD